MDDAARKALDQWAGQIAALESEVCDGILVRALQMAANRRLWKDDREFARAQMEAIGRAVVRQKSNRKNRRAPG